MAIGLEPWIYILRGYCALVVFVAIFVAVPFLSSLGFGDAISYKHPSGFRPLLISLFLLYLSDIAVLTTEAQSRGELPDATASISISVFALTSAVQLEKLATLEKVKLSVTYIYLGCWVLLSTVEFFTIIRLWLRPSFTFSPYPHFAITFTAVELLVYLALTFLFYHASCGGYESLTQTDIENHDAAPGSTRHDDDNNVSESDSNGCTTDPLGLGKEVREEVDELGGWWRFIKKFRIFLKFMWPFGNALLQLRFILTLFVVLAGRFISVYMPLQTATLLDALASGANPWHPLVAVIAINVADTVSPFVVKLLWIDVSLQRASKLKVEVQSKIMSLDFSFHSQAQPTDVINAIDQAGSVDTLLDSIIFAFVPNLVTFIVTIVQLFHRYGLYVILICTHTAAYYCIVEKRYMEVATEEYDKCNTLQYQQERCRQDSIRGWTTVSNHNRVEHETNLFRSVVGSWMSRRRRYQMICYAFSATQSIIVSLGFFACYAFVVYKIHSRMALVGDLVAFTGLWALLLDPIDYFTSIFSETIQELLDAARLRRILERKPSGQNGDQILLHNTGEIRFEHVSFSYPSSDRIIIKDLNFVIEGGSTVAFVGGSGTGKSTLVHLLAGNLYPTAGTIYINNQDIRTLDRDSLRRYMAIMSQDEHFFHSTVLENVRYGNLNATDNEVHDACNSAGIHETIMKCPSTYNTMMTTNGRNFSGGERQRILLARIFINNASKITLIDEGTSALDAQTELDIKKSIEQNLSNNTVILVAHRLSTIRHANQIFVLGTNGTFTEFGTHDELVANNGTYAGLWKMHIGDNIGNNTLIDVSA